MANLPPADIQAARQSSSGTRPFYEPANLPAPVAAKGPVWSFDRNLFVEQFARQPAMTEDRRSRLEGVVPGDKVELKSETVDGTRGFAEDYVKRIIRLRNTPASETAQRRQGLTEYDVLLAADVQAHNYDELLVTLCTSEDPSTHRTVFDQAKFESAMGNSEAWEAVQQIANITAREILASVGARAEIRPNGDRSNPNDIVGHEIDFQIDGGHQRPLNRWARGIARWWRNPTRIDGRAQNLTHGQQLLQIAGAITGAGLLTGSAGADVGLFAGAIQGGIGGAINGAVRGAGISAAAGALLTAGGLGIYRMSESGVRLALVRDNDSLTRNQTNSMSTRTRLLYGIDANDFTWNGNNLVLNPDNPGSTRIGLAISEALGLIGLRALYMQDLGIPPQKLDALPEQFIYNASTNFRNSGKEETGVHMDDEVYNRFRELRIATPPANFEAELGLFMQAQTDKVSDRLRMIMEKKTTTEDPYNLEALQRKITARTGDNPPELVTQTEEAQQRRERYQADVNSTTTQRDTFTTYDTTNTTNREAVQAATDAEAATYRGLNNRIGPIMSAANAITAIREVLDKGSRFPGSSIDGITDENNNPVGIINNLGEFRADFVRTAEATRIYAGMDRAQAAQERQTIQRDADQEVARLTTILTNKINQITTAQSEITRTRQTLEANPASLNTELENMTTALNDIVAYARRPAAMERLLRTRTFDQLVVLFNRMNVRDPNIGWPEAENGNADIRQRLIRAMEEARARDALTNNSHSIASGGSWEFNYQLLRAPASPYARLVSDHQLRVLDRAEIRAIGIPATYMTDASIDEAQEWARIVETTRLDQINTAQRQAQTSFTLEDRGIQTIGERLTREREQLETIRRIAQDQANGTISERAVAEFGSNEAQRALQTPGRVAATNTPSKNNRNYTAQENGLPTQFLEVMDMLTGYQNADNRGQDFEQIRNRLQTLVGGEQNLATILYQTFFPGTAIPATPTYVTFSGLLSRPMSPIFIRQGMERFARILIGRGMTL